MATTETKQLTVKSQMAVNDMMVMAKTFAESGMFVDTKQAAQAFVKIQAGMEMGIPPFASMSGIHIIQGKPTIGAGLMAARIKSGGKYDYKVVKQDEKECSIDFYQGKEKIGNSTFTIEEAKKAQTKNLDKFPKNMLFARAISNGVKWYCPDVFDSPVYVPEEMEQATEDIAHEEIKDTPPATKPIITTGQFTTLLSRVEGGDLEAADKAMQAFELDADQQDALSKAYLTGQNKAA